VLCFEQNKLFWTLGVLCLERCLQIRVQQRPFQLELQ